MLNVITGLGTEVAEPLVRHPDVSCHRLHRQCPDGTAHCLDRCAMMKKLHLELGGKDAFVIAEDADPEIAARALAYAALTNRRSSLHLDRARLLTRANARANS